MNKSENLHSEITSLTLKNHKNKIKTISLDEYVGQKLRDFRERAGLTLLDLAGRLAVSHQQLHKYETGQTKISSGILYKLCKIFSITPNCFFDGFSPEENQDVPDATDDLINHETSGKIDVLFVEDSGEDQYLVRKALEDYNSKINIYCMHDGEEFFNIIKKKSNITTIPIPDLIFLDINMPKIDGNALLRSIKQNRDLQHIPVIILTGSISRKDVMNAYKNYASGYVRKSFDYETLKKNLHLALSYWTEAVVMPNQAWS
jgi:CheY-like chemotaxis protein/DNA-binding transcriptional regulator YiaG